MRGKTRQMLLALTVILISITGTLFAAELALRFMPVNDGLRAQAVDAANPVFRFQSNRSSTWSEGWNLESVNRVRVNNDGFVNDQDYDPNATTPLLAVIGDSYIEAGMVPFGQTVAGRLAKDVGPGGRVYSFAASGAGLTQYVVWASYARDRYRPQAYVFSIIANDFDEALWHRGRSPGFHHFERHTDGTSTIRRVDYQPSFWRRVLRRSALAMYLVTNMKVQRIFDFSVQNLGAKDTRWSANIPYESTEAELADYHWAVDRFLDALPEATGVAPNQIVLTFDAIRPDLYDPALANDAERGTWGIMRTYVMDQARARGMGVVDMHPVFVAHYAREHRHFESPNDGHWNAMAHGLVTTAVEDTPMFHRFIDSVKVVPAKID